MPRIGSDILNPPITRLVWKPQIGPQNALVKCPLPEIRATECEIARLAAFPPRRH
jgi:hypothetical protein